MDVSLFISSRLRPWNVISSFSFLWEARNGFSGGSDDDIFCSAGRNGLPDDKGVVFLRREVSTTSCFEMLDHNALLCLLSIWKNESLSLTNKHKLKHNNKKRWVNKVVGIVVGKTDAILG